MKIRTDFVTNSSSSSFTLEIRFDLKNGNKLVFEDTGGTAEGDRGEHFIYDAVANVSPKQLGTARDVDELIRLLTDGIIDYEETGEIPKRKIFEDTKSKAYRFIKKLKKEVKSMDDIRLIKISGDEFNYGTNYTRIYMFDRDAKRYYGLRQGDDFVNVDGTRGGDLQFSDADKCDDFRLVDESADIEEVYREIVDAAAGTP